MPQLVPVPLGLYDQLVEGSGRVILASSQAHEKSWIKGGATNSLFATHLLSALRGQSITTEQKTVNILDVFKHVSKAVPADAQTIGVAQTPVLKAFDVTQDFPVALLLGGQGLSPDSGGGSSDTLPVRSGSQPSKPIERDREWKRKLVNALLACPTMSDRARRDAVVNDLPDEIRNNISRHPADRVDVNNIVSICLNYTNGIEELVDIVRNYEGNSIGMQKVDALM